jgi:hypothetical protein
MTTREFIQHLLLNGELDDQVCIEVGLPENPDHKYYSYTPTHVTRIGEGMDMPTETLIECKLVKGQE